MNNQIYLSIDFGTCNTVISYFLSDNIIKQLSDNISNDVLIPSTLYFLSDNINSYNINDFLPDEHYIIGSVANETFNFNKDYNNYFYQFKRFLGINSKSINHYKNFLSKYNLDYDVDDDTIYFYLN